MITGLWLLALMFFTGAGCGKASDAVAPAAKHEHHPPHGGIPVVLGAEVYHLELVLDAGNGRLQAFILDGELENFIRSSAASFDVVAVVEGREQTLTFKPVANPATGETAGDTALFETQADWLKTTKSFDAVLKTLTVRGTTFNDVKFNYPKGNDTDAR